MISIDLYSPYEEAREIAKKARAKRLALNWSQKTLSQRSGVAYGTLKKFELTGQISLEALLKIALVLGEFEMFTRLFEIDLDNLPNTLSELEEESTRKRGRL